MIAALAEGESSIVGLSPGRDVEATARITEQLGATRRFDGDTVILTGASGGLRSSATPLDCGNSGTTIRLMTGVVSAVEGQHVLIGDESLSRRPMDRIARPLGLMGSLVEGTGASVRPPLYVTGSIDLVGIDYAVPIASAQVKSAILFAGLSGAGPTTVHEDVRTRSTTEEMFRLAGLDVRSDDRRAGRRVTVEPGRPKAVAWRVPGDPSQAAFFAVLGAVHADATIEVADVATARERTGFVGVLQRMGADVVLATQSSSTSLRSKSSVLRATEIHASEIPSVDEVPALVVAAAAATGVSVFREMGELRLKESDRFDGALALALALGCRAWSDGDDLFVEGLGSASKFQSFTFDASLDHRMVMACAIAGCAGAGSSIDGAETVASSYPGFFDDLESLS